MEEIDKGMEVPLSGGLEFDIPPGAVPQGKRLELSVWPCSAGPFQLPEDYELASPVLLVSPNFEFSIDVTITMHHFYNLHTREDCDNMAFLTAPATPGHHQTKLEWVIQVFF